MATRGARPPGGARERQWESLTLKEDQRVTGWIAGPAVGARIHPPPFKGGRSKPCIRAYCGRAANCVGCERGQKLDYLFYQPIYRESDDRRCVIRVHDDQLTILDRLVLHDYVTAHKPEQVSVGVQILKRPTQVTYTTTIATRRTEADISDWLPVLWSLVGVITGTQLLRGPLESHDEIRLAPAAIVTSDPPAPVVPDAIANRSVIADALRGVGLTVDGTPLTELSPTGARVVRPEHRNGKPKR